MIGAGTALAGLVITIVALLATSHAPGSSNPPSARSASPTVTLSESATPTFGATPGTSTPVPVPVDVVVPSALAITVNGGSGGLPVWASWLGPIGGFLTGIGALGGLVAFRRRREQEEEAAAQANRGNNGIVL